MSFDEFSPGGSRLLERARRLRPEGWVEEAPFRETFIARMESSELRHKIRRQGACLSGELAERGRERVDAEAVAARLAGVIADLDHCRGELAELALLATTGQLGSDWEGIGEPAVEGAQVLVTLARHLRRIEAAGPARCGGEGGTSRQRVGGVLAALGRPANENPPPEDRTDLRWAEARPPLGRSLRSEET